MPYTASKSPSKDRPGFNISFRHPLRMDSKGKVGLKVRRGLGTSDVAEADRLVAQMNELLADESWWNSGRYGDAMDKFDKIIVDAFYDGLQASVASNPASLRDEYIHLPDSSEGYARVLFVGTTGAGKTSLLRHLIGSDSERDRFPSTSTAKTTVSDIEVIPQDGPFRAAVTFFSEHAIQANVEDCVIAAASAVWDNMDVEKVADKLLHHADQRFRLSYLLGAWTSSPAKENDDDWDFGGQAQPNPAQLDDVDAVSSEDAKSLQRKLTEYVERLTELATSKAKAIKTALLPDWSTAQPDDVQAALEIFQSDLLEEDKFWDLVFDIMDDIRRRVQQLGEGSLTWRGKKSAWPELWTCETSDRDDFLRQVRWFSSNYAPAFGRLLTPLVDGIRVSGPLFPRFTDRRPKVVYFDGQGLGHTPDSSSSVTTHVTQRFGDVDVIMLVDNAEQPVQAAAQAVLRAVAASGNYGKLVIAFTHFDHVKGLNLPRFAEKRQHVLASVHSYLGRLREVLNGPIVTAMERTIDTQCVMLGGLDQASDKLPGGVRTQLDTLFNHFEKSIRPVPILDAEPEYDYSKLAFSVQRAAASFQRTWEYRLGLAQSANTQKEHWTRVKALNRRIATELDVEYDSLRPVADFVGRMTEEISNFLDHPVKWKRAPVDETEAQEAIAPIRQAVFSELHTLATTRIVREQLSEWRRSLEIKGGGSARRRAREIRGIYEVAASVPEAGHEDLLKAVLEIVSSAVEIKGRRSTLDLERAAVS